MLSKLQTFYSVWDTARSSEEDGVFYVKLWSWQPRQNGGRGGVCNIHGYEEPSQADSSPPWQQTHSPSTPPNHHRCVSNGPTLDPTAAVSWRRCTPSTTFHWSSSLILPRRLRLGTSHLLPHCACHSHVSPLLYLNLTTLNITQKLRWWYMHIAWASVHSTTFVTCFSWYEITIQQNTKGTVLKTQRLKTAIKCNAMFYVISRTVPCKYNRNLKVLLTYITNKSYLC